MQRNTKLSTGNICKPYLKRKKPTSYPQKADHSPATKNKIEHKKATGRLGILPIPNWTIPINTLSETHFAVTFCIFSLYADYTKSKPSSQRILPIFFSYEKIGRLHSPYYDVLHLHEFSARFSISPTQQASGSALFRVPKRSETRCPSLQSR